jgi:hypothetical protein
MSKYFKEVELVTPVNPADTKPKTIKRFNKERLKGVFRKIDEELERVKNGVSTYTTYAIRNSFGSPAENRLRIFKLDPTEDNYKAVLEITTQDFGVRLSDYFKELIEKTREEVPNE